METNNNQGNKDPKKLRPRFNLSWLYWGIGLTLLTFWFANESGITVTQEIFSAVAIAVIALAYAVYLLKKVPE